MSATVTNTTLSTTFTPSEIETNFQDVVNKFGSINNADIASSAGIVATKLASRKQEVYLQLVCRSADLAAGWPGGNVIVDAVPIPGSNGDDVWTVTDISWVCSDTGTADATFSVVVGTYSGGTWSSSATLANTVTIDRAAADDNGNQGKAVEDGTDEVGYSTTATSIGLMSVGAGTNVLTGAGGNTYDFIRVTVRLVRDLQGA